MQQPSGNPEGQMTTGLAHWRSCPTGVPSPLRQREKLFSLMVGPWSSEFPSLLGASAYPFPLPKKLPSPPGGRCHAVTPFTGDRYSIVWFTLMAHEKATAASREALRGNTWPTPALQSFWGGLLAPPKGLRQSGIRTKLGLGDEFPAAIQYSGTSLTKDALVLRFVLNFVLTPLAMESLCALSRAARRECLRPESWQDSVVDTDAIAPSGRQAFRHWQLWAGARAVVHGRWACTNVSLLMSGRFGTWRWQGRQGSAWVRAGGEGGNRLVCVSQRPVPAMTVSVRFQQRPAQTTCIGLVSTNQVSQITASVFGESPRNTFVGAIFVEGDRVFLVCGEETLCASKLRLSDGCLVTIGVHAQQLAVEVSPKVVRAPARIDMSERSWFASVVMHEEIAIQPCWTLLG